MSDQSQMPLYQSHKKVYALQIGRITSMASDHNGHEQVYRLEFMTPGFAPRDFPKEMFSRFMPSHGDYYVQYEDGYESFSPRKAFEDGYTLV